MKKSAKLRGSGRGWSAKKKRVGALKGGRRVDCKKMCEVKRVGALRGRRRVDYEKMCEIKEGLCIKRQVEGGLRKNVRN